MSSILGWAWYKFAVPTVQELRAWAAEDRAMVLKLRARADKLERWAEEAERRAEEMEADEAGTSNTLTPALTAVKVNVNKAVTDEHRFNIARGQKRGDKFLAAITAAEFTQKTLAEKLRIAPALLSMYRKNKRPIPRDRAEEIEKLTGWKADVRHWPGGIVP